MLVVSAGRRLIVYEVEPDALDALAPGRLIQRAWATVYAPLRVLTVAAAAGRGQARPRPRRGCAACVRGATTAGPSCAASTRAPLAQSCASQPGAAGRAAPRVRRIAVLVYYVAGLAAVGRILKTRYAGWPQECLLRAAPLERATPAATNQQSRQLRSAGRRPRAAGRRRGGHRRQRQRHVHRGVRLPPRRPAQARAGGAAPALGPGCRNTGRPNAPPKQSLRVRTMLAGLFSGRRCRAARAAALMRACQLGKAASMTSTRTRTNLLAHTVRETPTLRPALLAQGWCASSHGDRAAGSRGLLCSCGACRRCSARTGSTAPSAAASWCTGNTCPCAPSVPCAAGATPTRARQAAALLQQSAGAAAAGTRHALLCAACLHVLHRELTPPGMGSAWAQLHSQHVAPCPALDCR